MGGDRETDRRTRPTQDLNTTASSTEKRLKKEQGNFRASSTLFGTRAVSEIENYIIYNGHITTLPNNVLATVIVLSRTPASVVPPSPLCRARGECLFAQHTSDSSTNYDSFLN